jgi:hypothetical protein
MIQGDTDADMFADFEAEDKEGERNSCSRICFGLCRRVPWFLEAQCEIIKRGLI